MSSSLLHHRSHRPSSWVFIPLLLVACSSSPTHPVEAKGNRVPEPKAQSEASPPSDLPKPVTGKAAEEQMIAPLVHWTTIGQSVEGRPIHCATMGTGPDILLIIATIHGNEAAGTPLVQRFMRELEKAPLWLEGRTLAVVPVANPDGLARARRRNPKGVDLNRNFPSDNYRGTRGHGKEPLSQPESQALHQFILDLKPARVVSIHQPLKCVDWDGPAEKLARAMAASGPLPAKRLGSRPGSLGSWVGLTLNTPIITLELPRSADKLSEDALYATYGPMLATALRNRSMVSRR